MTTYPTTTRRVLAAVLAAVLVALDRPEDYPALVALTGESLTQAVLTRCPPERADFVGRLLSAAGRPLAADSAGSSG